jgi:sortase A
MKRQRLLLLTAVLAVVAAACASTALVMNRGGTASAGDDPRLVASTIATTTTTVAPTTTTAPRPTTTTTLPLPVPAASPSDPYANVPVNQIGTVEIPRIGLNHPIYEGIWLTVINEGPGHWPGTALPGQRGNAVFPGHRVTHTHPFLNLDLLRPGDLVIFHMANGTFTYSVTGTQIVRPTDMWVIDQTPEPTMTLIACHPKHSAAQRIVVKGKLVRSAPAGS